MARQIVETVDSEEPLQVELPKLRRSASQPNLREERWGRLGCMHAFSLLE